MGTLRQAGLLGSHAHPVPALRSEGRLPLCSAPFPPYPLGACALLLTSLALLPFLCCSSRKSPWDPQSTVLPPSDACQEVPPFYPCLSGFHQSSLPERQEVWSAGAQLLTGSSLPGDKAPVWMFPQNGPQDRPSGRLSRARTHLCPSCSASSSSSEGKQMGEWLLGDPQPTFVPEPYFRPGSRARLLPFLRACWIVETPQRYGQGGHTMPQGGHSLRNLCEPHTACRILCARLNDSPSQDITHDCECPLHVGKVCRHLD